MRFRVNNPEVVSELIDGEVVMINLANGNYYSLKGFGAVVWSYLERGVSSEQLLELLPARFDASREDVVDAAEQLVRSLREEHLIVDDETAVPAADALEIPAGSKEPFESISLETHRDMQDLILLDPVHEVDERGWPYAQAQSGA